MPTDIDILRKIDRIHPYPAKFPVDLAMNYISKYTNIGNTVYDPFVGSGTTLLASRALERNAYGTDVNHIAVLISQFKLLSLSQNDIKELWDFIARFENSFFDIVKTVPRFYYKSIDHWFCADAITVLSVIKSEISKLGKNEQKIFCNLVFSSIINTVSNQESDTRYAAIIKPNLNIQHIFDVFVKKFKTILSLFEIYNEKFIMKSNCEVLLSDSQYCNQILKLNSVDLILTSPPYPNTYDYYLYHKHRMNWLECDVKYSMETEIGSRREYSSLKKPQEKFSEDLFIIFNSCNDVLKQNGHVVIVMGDGKIQGKTYEAKENIDTSESLHSQTNVMLCIGRSSCIPAHVSTGITNIHSSPVSSNTSRFSPSVNDSSSLSSPPGGPQHTGGSVLCRSKAFPSKTSIPATAIFIKSSFCRNHRKQDEKTPIGGVFYPFAAAHVCLSALYHQRDILSIDSLKIPRSLTVRLRGFCVLNALPHFLLYPSPGVR